MTRARATRAKTKKRLRDENLEDFVPIEEEAGVSKREQALARIRQAKRVRLEASDTDLPSSQAPSLERPTSPLVKKPSALPTVEKQPLPASKIPPQVRRSNSRADPSQTNVMKAFSRLQRDLCYSNVYTYATEVVWRAFDIKGISDDFKSSLQASSKVGAEEGELDSTTLKEMIDRAKAAPIDTPPAIGEEREENMEEKEEEGNIPFDASVPLTDVTVEIPFS